MHYHISKIIIFLMTTISYHVQSQLYNPLNYLDQLPTLKMPYVNNVPIPNIPLAHIIKPTPTITTKVINVVTKYVSRNPVCIKSSGKKKPPCKKDSSSAHKIYANDHLITKEYFVKNKNQNRQARTLIEEEHLKKLKQEIDAFKNLLQTGSRKNNESSTTHKPLESSETSYSYAESGNHETRFENGEITHHRMSRDIDGFLNRATPELEERKLITAGGVHTDEKLKDMLIEDRLDRLEDMLPHYTRMRVYQTSTITVTRTRTARMATATLMVKNCVPDGIDYCKTRQKTTSNSGNKKKKRKSKVALEQSPVLPNYNPYYYG